MDAPGTTGPPPVGPRARAGPVVTPGSDVDPGTDRGAEPGAEPGADVVEIDARVAHEARMYDYLLGGDVNFTVDRVLAERAAAAIGGLANARASARANRGFLARAVRHLAAEGGLRQFLDVGTGIPLSGTADVVARHSFPGTRTVYVDNDPIVLAHAHVLARQPSTSPAAYVDADLREPDAVLARAAATLDLTEPTVLVLGAVLHGVGDPEAHRVVAHLADALAPGSYLVVSHLAADIAPEAMAEMARCLERGTGGTVVLRDRAEVTRFFDGLDVVAPGVVQVDQWHPRRARPLPTAVWVPPVYGGVGRTR
jgi:O-methyltransferase involved in polyketide biosynthesis